MQKENITLTVEPRKTGKHFSRALRRTKQVPAVVYGPKIENFEITLQEGELNRYMKQQFENSIFTFESSDKNLKGLKVLKKEVVVHPVTRKPQHVDFFALDLTKSVRVYVEIRFEGKAEGAREGGLVSLINREVEIECLPTDIPPFITLDISSLGLNDSMHVSDLKVPAGIKIITSVTSTLCTCSIVEEEVIAAPVAAAAEGAAAAPGTEGAAAPGAPAAAGAAAPAAGKADAAKAEKK